uniref:Uncharacterized protein n=1 Tax=Arundo donax TaxID=35708 RepID=A0A0A9A898_ARUDO
MSYCHCGQRRVQVQAWLPFQRMNSRGLQIQ